MATGYNWLGSQHIKLQLIGQNIFSKVSKISIIFMNLAEYTIVQRQIRKPFESKIASKESKNKVEFFQKLLKEIRRKNKSIGRVSQKY